LLDGFGPDAGAAVGLVVAVDGGDDDVVELHEGELFGDAAGLVVIDGERFTGFDVAEAAGAGAGVAEDHDGCDAAGPALAHVGAAGFFADGEEVVLTETFAEFVELFAARDFGFEPLGLLFEGELVLDVLAAVCRAVVEDHTGEGDGGGVGSAHGVAAEGAWVSLEGALEGGVGGGLGSGEGAGRGGGERVLSVSE